MPEVKRDQCCKCRWVGTYEEKSEKDDPGFEGWKIDICPVCGHNLFYKATERQYQNYLKRCQA